MSTLSTTHDVVSNADKKAKAFEGQRLVSLWFKQSKEQKAQGVEAKKPVAVSVPVLSLSNEQLVTVKAYVVSYFQSVQDKIIRSKVEDDASFITDSDISLEACIAFLEEDSKGARLNGEAIGEWFTETLADVLTVAFAEKLGVSDTPTEYETKKLETLVGMYKTKFASLASPKTSYPKEVSENLLKALELVGDDDILAAKFKARLTGMTQDSIEFLGL